MTAAPSNRARGAFLGLLAAVLFGASAPIAKLLLRELSPLWLSALFYVGAALGLSAYRLAFRSARSGRDPSWSRTDGMLLIGVILIGGVAGPVLLFLGLQRVSGVVGSLLLNLEAVFTMVLATAFFAEHLGKAEAVGGTLVVAGAALLGMRPGELGASWTGALAISGACFCWAVDNNLTQRLSHHDPTAIARFKTAGAGATSLLLAVVLGQRAPGAAVVATAAFVGSLSYGVSLVLAVYSLRYVGAAREAAFFAVAPFAGALFAVPLLGQGPTAEDWGAGALMAFGVVALVRARHGHVHRHEAIVHEHEHVHDEHHSHEHGPGVVEPHTHPHQHDPLEHDHPHVSDEHHRHTHR